MLLCPVLKGYVHVCMYTCMLLLEYVYRMWLSVVCIDHCTCINRQESVLRNVVNTTYIIHISHVLPNT